MPAPDWAEVAWDGRHDRIEYAWLQPSADTCGRPLLVFLHEGLGSLALWKDFPQRVCEAAGCRGLVFSRWGYGRSTPRQAHETWGLDFMHRQAEHFLPAFFKALGLDTERDPPCLVGHSDGASIALLYAAAVTRPVAGLVVLAPHILVEPLSVRSIAAARDQFQAEGGTLRARLARYHNDVDGAFWGWNQAWLDPDFLNWDITTDLPRITCPILAIQGEDDEYGTMAQIEGIARRVPRTQLLKLRDCGHSPHRDQPDAVVAAIRAFCQPLPPRGAGTGCCG